MPNVGHTTHFLHPSTGIIGGEYVSSHLIDQHGMLRLDRAPINLQQYLHQHYSSNVSGTGKAPLYEPYHRHIDDGFTFFNSIHRDLHASGWWNEEKLCGKAPLYVPQHRHVDHSFTFSDSMHHDLHAYRWWNEENLPRKRRCRSCDVWLLHAQARHAGPSYTTDNDVLNGREKRRIERARQFIMYGSKARQQQQQRQ